MNLTPWYRGVRRSVFSLALLCALSVVLTGVSCGGGQTGAHPHPLDFNNLCDTNNGGHCTLSFALTVGGTPRIYLLHIPPHYQFNVTPLVIFLHGTGSSAQFSESQTGLDATADQNGFAIVFANSGQPNLNFPVWDIFFSDPTPAVPDDVAFLRALIQDLDSKIHPDPKRIYVAGFSIGAAMAERAGVELSDVVAAVASIEGTLKVDFLSVVNVPAASAPVSVLILHADRPDEMVPYCGGPNIQFNNWLFYSQENTFNYWSGLSANSCQSVTPNAALCDGMGNITSVVTKVATNCNNGTEVRLYRMQGGNHTWWTGPMNDPARVPYNPDLDASTGITTNDIVWKFFAAHPKQ